MPNEMMHFLIGLVVWIVLLLPLVRLGGRTMNSDYKSMSRYVSSYLGSLKTHSTVVDGQEWRYIDGGKGETIVFLHGLAGSKMVWRSFMQSYVGKYRVIAIDIPGMCVEQRLNNRKHTFRELANWLELFLERFNLDKFHLVAHSIGCSIASCFAGSHPSRISSIALLNHPDVLMEDKADQVKSVFDVFLNPELLESIDGWNETFGSLFYSVPRVPNIIQRYRQKALLKHLDAFKQVIEDLSGQRALTMTYLRQLRCPVLTVATTHDVFAPMEFHDSLKNQIPWGQHALVEECGHLSFLEKSEEVLELHSGFLKSIECTSPMIEQELVS